MKKKLALLALSAFLMFAPFAEAKQSKLLDRDFMKTATPADIRKEIEKGADVNARDKDGVTALVFAAVLESPEVAKILIQNGADVNARYKDGTTALDLAYDSENAEVITVLENYRRYQKKWWEIW